MTKKTELPTYLPTYPPTCLPTLPSSNMKSLLGGHVRRVTDLL